MAFHVRLSRRTAKREPLRRFVIFCEGEKTEPAYFRALERKYKRNTLIDLEIVPVGVPMTIAQRASAQMKRRGRNSFEEKDQIWAVFDRDEHPNYEAAIGMCRQNRVHVARSNPCFELWLILHESDYDSSDHRGAVQRRLKSLRPEYDPANGKSCDCMDLVLRVEQAEARASRQLQRREQEGAPFGPPSTTVGHLTAAIREAALAAGSPF